MYHTVDSYLNEHIRWCSRRVVSNIRTYVVFVHVQCGKKERIQRKGRGWSLVPQDCPKKATNPNYCTRNSMHQYTTQDTHFSVLSLYPLYSSTPYMERERIFLASSPLPKKQRSSSSSREILTFSLTFSSTQEHHIYIVDVFSSYIYDKNQKNTMMHNQSQRKNMMILS
jgi:hypothetical protein